MVSKHLTILTHKRINGQTYQTPTNCKQKTARVNCKQDLPYGDPEDTTRCKQQHSSSRHKTKTKYKQKTNQQTRNHKKQRNL